MYRFGHPKINYLYYEKQYFYGAKYPENIYMILVFLMFLTQATATRRCEISQLDILSLRWIAIKNLFFSGKQVHVVKGSLRACVTGLIVHVLEWVFFLLRMRWKPGPRLNCSPFNWNSTDRNGHVVVLLTSLVK